MGRVPKRAARANRESCARGQPLGRHTRACPRVDLDDTTFLFRSARRTTRNAHRRCKCECLKANTDKDGDGDGGGGGGGKERGKDDLCGYHLLFSLLCSARRILFSRSHDVGAVSQVDGQRILSAAYKRVGGYGRAFDHLALALVHCSSNSCLCTESGVTLTTTTTRMRSSHLCSLSLSLCLLITLLDFPRVYGNSVPSPAPTPRC